MGWILLVLFSVAIPVWIVVAAYARAHRQAERGDLPPARSRAPRATGVGRSAIKAYRAYGDAKSIARGTYGKRLVRHAVFRGIWKL